MPLRWRLVLPGAAAPSDVVVAAAAGSTLADLRAALAARVAVGDLVVHVDGAVVAEEAPLGLPPMLDGATLTLAQGAAEAPTSALLQLHARSGPDAGFVFDLPRGEHLLGRAVEASVRLDDADVSRAHAILDVRTREVTVRDAGSTNGTYLDGIPLGSQPVPFGPAQTLRAGQTTLALSVPRHLPAAVRPDGAGHLLVNRSPRLVAPAPDEVVELPQEPVDPAPSRLSWLAAVLPLALSAAIAAVLRSPTMLLFGLMSPVLVVGQWVGDRRGARRARRTAHARYAVDLAAARQRLADALAAETAARHDADPDPATILAVARRPLSRLWERDARDDGIRARVGVGTLDARTRCCPGETSTVGPVPVAVDLSAAGGLGIAGPRSAALAVARTVLGRVATTYSPRDLHLVVVAPPERRRDWDWMRRLPHADALADAPADVVLEALARGVADRAPTPGTAQGRGPRILAVLDGASALRSHPGLPAVLTDGHRSGIHVLALDSEVPRLPAETGTALDLAPVPPTLTVRDHAHPLDVTVDAVSLGWAEQVAEALGPLRDAAPAEASGLGPTAVSLLQLLALHEVSADALAERWSRTPRSTAFPIGADGTGTVVLDLVRDGPHALVGGTTGSGKSELLLTLVASLAAGNRPDELAFVLVDYKGGAAFGACADLPHVVGVVTDLDAHLTERAMTSLDAELKRRERRLAEHGCRDLTEYHARRRPGDPPLPRLVLVVDEFRALAEELPGFVTGLVRVASLGRSLGIHLVVATQRPAGVVTADMRANLGLRIALRVRDVVDSLDVIDAPDAARIHERTPGRAVLRSAATDLGQFQCALVTGRTAVQRGVRLLSVDGVPVASGNGCPDTDLSRLVAACGAAATRCGAEPVAPPWLPPLPAVVPCESLAAAPGHVAIGLLDDPAAQAQPAYSWDVGAGHLAITGPPRSGRSTALATVVAQLARATSPADVHVYAVHRGPLASLEALAHVGAAVDVADLPRLERLVRMLGAPHPASSALRVLVVDDWDVVAATLLKARQQPLLDALVELVRRGHDNGLRAVVAGSRQTTTGPLSGVFAQRLLLLPADPVDLAVAGLASQTAPAHARPGHALELPGGRAVQLALPGAAGPPTARTAYLSALAERVGREYAGLPPSALPTPLPPLPARVRAGELPALPEVLVVGVGCEGPVGLRPGAGQRRVAVLGGSGSGRTSTLATLAAGLQRLGLPVATVSPTATTVLQGVAVFGPRDHDALVALRRATPNLALLVDDAERLAGTTIEPVVAEIARLVDADDGFVAVAATIRDACERRQGLAATVAASGCGLLLGSRQPGDENALGTRTLVPFGAHPGRAHLVRDGAVEVIQVAR